MSEVSVSKGTGHVWAMVNFCETCSYDLAAVGLRDKGGGVLYGKV